MPTARHKRRYPRTAYRGGYRALQIPDEQAEEAIFAAHGSWKRLGAN
ncbi:hypothetical protein ACLB1O_22445 [Escherichia coli]